MKVSYQSRVKSTKEPAVPMNVHVHDLLMAIDDAEEFANFHRVQDLIRLPPEAFYNIWDKGYKEKTYLDGVDRALRIRAIHKRVSDAVGLAPQWERRAAPCVACGKELGNWNGSHLVQCSDPDCGDVMSRDEYDAYCVELSKE